MYYKTTKNGYRLLLVLLLVTGLAWGDTYGNPAWAGPLLDRVSEFPAWASPPKTQRVATEELWYPSWFAGEWLVTSTLQTMSAPQAPTLLSPGFESNRQFLNKPVKFGVRFAPQLLPPRGGSFGQLLQHQSLRNNSVVADRAFNGLSIAIAYLGRDRIQRVEQDPRNSNRQLIRLSEGLEIVSRVIARATEQRSELDFTATEVTTQSFRGASVPYGNQVEATTDYRYDPVGHVIEAEQYTATYLSPKDPNYLKAPNQPIALYHYHLHLERAPQLKEMSRHRNQLQAARDEGNNSLGSDPGKHGSIQNLDKGVIMLE